MVSVDRSEIEGGLELADGTHLTGLEVPVYNSVEVVPVASELYPVASADTKNDILTSSSTSHLNLETENQYSPSYPSRKSSLIRRKSPLWIFAGVVLLSVVCITIGVLAAKALQGKSGNYTSDRSSPLPKTPTTSDIQTTTSASSYTTYPQGITTKVSLSISVATSLAITTPPTPTTLQTSASLSSDPITTTTSGDTFTSRISSTLVTNSCPNPPIIKCSDLGCEGINDQLRIGGMCTAGMYNGCHCVSVCGDVPGPCSLNNCIGVNNVCLNGIYRGCNCS